MTRQEYQFIELAGSWGSIPKDKQDHIIGYTRHKRAAGWGVGAILPLAAFVYFLAHLLQFVR